MTDERAIYQEIVDNALAATQAQLVVLTRFERGTLEIETMAWSGLNMELIERGMAVVRRLWPDFEIGRYVAGRTRTSGCGVPTSRASRSRGRCTTSPAGWSTTRCFAWLARSSGCGTACSTRC